MRAFLAINLLMFVVGCGGNNSNSVDIVDVIDHTPNYKGKTLTMDLEIDENIFPDKGQSLQDYVGKGVKFNAFGPKMERLSIVINIPRGLVVPKAAIFEHVIVTFVCNDGNLQHGNEAKSIGRR
jgi:hypothetical protein